MATQIPQAVLPSIAWFFFPLKWWPALVKILNKANCSHLLIYTVGAFLQNSMSIKIVQLIGPTQWCSGNILLKQSWIPVEYYQFGSLVELYLVSVQPWSSWLGRLRAVRAGERVMVWDLHKHAYLPHSLVFHTNEKKKKLYRMYKTTCVYCYNRVRLKFRWVQETIYLHKRPAPYSKNTSLVLCSQIRSTFDLRPYSATT